MRNAKLFFACALALPAAVAQAVDRSDLAECKLTWDEAKAALAGLTVLRRDDLSDPDDYDMSYEVDTKYDASALRPLGLKAITFVHEDFGDSNYLVARLSVDYAQVRAKLLAAHGRTACVKELESAKDRLHLCQVVRTPKSDPKPTVWLDEKAKGTIEIQCAYGAR